MTVRRFTLVLLAVAASGLFACGGGGTSTTSRTVGPHALEVRVTTNVPEINQVLNTALSGDEIEMARLTGYQKVPCSPFPGGDSPPPLCRSDEPSGTPVEVFGLVNCDGKATWVRPEDVPHTYRSSLGASDVQLAGVYAPKPPSTRFDSQYVAVMTSGQRESSPAGVAVYFHSGRIVALEDACGDVSRLLTSDRVASWVVEPTPAAGSPVATP